MAKENNNESNSKDLDEKVFTMKDPKEIAKSLKNSVEKNARKLGNDFESAMSMLNFYINRTGKKIDEKQKEVLEKTKEELRKLFNK